MNDSNCVGPKKRSKLKQIKIRVTEDNYELICSVAKKYKLKIAVLIRAVLEDKLEKFNEKCRYTDTEQGKKIEACCREISKELRHINNSINRIGVNYNQEVKLKNAEQKFKTLSDDVSTPLGERTKALEEYNKIKREMNYNGLDMDELKNVLAAFEKATTRMEDMLCLIQE